MSIKMSVSQQGNLLNVLQKQKKQLKQLPKEAFDLFKQITPIDTGNAKNKTKFSSRNGGVIEANYQYAGVLDKGRHMTNRGMRGSKQAPRGMSKPTQQFINKRVKEILSGK